MSRFAFVPGSPFSGDADEVQAELDSIRRSGGLTPAAVVAVARPKNSSLHPIIFHVDKDEASERYYLQRAQQLLVSIVVVDVNTEEPTPVRWNVRMDTHEGSRYIPLDEEGAREQQMARLRRDMVRLKRQLKAIEEFPGVVAALEEALA